MGVGGAGPALFSKQFGVRAASQQLVRRTDVWILESLELQSMRVGLDASHPGGAVLGLGRALLRHKRVPHL